MWEYDEQQASAAHQTSKIPAAQPELDPLMMVTTFLKHIAYGKQDEAENLLRQDPALAVATGEITDFANRTFKGITGFQYAVWALDWHMWRMIVQYLSSEQAIAQAKLFTIGSWVSEHGEHANWKNLIDAYQFHIANCRSWTVEQCKDYWIKTVGGAQRQLPIHVLQEYCHPDRRFDPCPTFKEDKFPRNLDVDISKIAVYCALYRGMERWRREAWNVWQMGLDGRVDSVAISALFETRISQRGELVVELSVAVLRRAAKPR